MYLCLHVHTYIQFTLAYVRVHVCYAYVQHNYVDIHLCTCMFVFVIYII